MPCFRPLRAWLPPRGSEDTRLVFKESLVGFSHREVGVPCGVCIGCRMMRADEWKTRLSHELKFHDASCFLTLTYNDDWLPDSFSVAVRPLQLFCKRLRKFSKKAGLKFFGCGEYGDAGHRPHYHVCVFGFDFVDKYAWRTTKSGFLSYRSAQLERLWPFGHCEIGTVTPQSCGYVARYVMKKQYGRQAAEHYRRVHPITGEVVQVLPEFLVMSKNLGKAWFDAYHMDAFPSDFVVVDGERKPVPRYYRKLASKRAVRSFVEAEAAARRADFVSGPVRPDDTPERRAVREEVMARRVSLLKRGMENDS